MPEDIEWVEMRHPDIHTDDAGHEPATVSRAAFDAVWKDKGWEIVEPEAATAAPRRRASSTTTTTPEA